MLKIISTKHLLSTATTASSSAIAPLDCFHQSIHALSAKMSINKLTEDFRSDWVVQMDPRSPFYSKEGLLRLVDLFPEFVTIDDHFNQKNGKGLLVMDPTGDMGTGVDYLANKRSRFTGLRYRSKTKSYTHTTRMPRHPSVSKPLATIIKTVPALIMSGIILYHNTHILRAPNIAIYQYKIESGGHSFSVDKDLLWRI